MVFITVQAAVIGLRFSASARSRPFRIPLSIGKLPVPPVIVIIAATALLTQFEWRVYAIGFGIIGLGTLTHLVRGGRKRRQSTAAGHQVADASP
jgi:APA family basic amino acid/polyamine antiporter